MSEEITWLEVPEDATQHAERFGAQRDAETGEWCVIGEVHGELMNYLPRPRNSHLHKRAPSCPVCGASTRKCVNRWGNPFWGCSTWASTRCRGAIDFEEYAGYGSGLTPASDVVHEIADRLIGVRNVEKVQSGQSRRPRTKLTPEVKALWPEILGFASETFGREDAVIQWLKSPSIALGGAPPLDVIGTIEGCETVRKLIVRIRASRMPDAEPS